MVRCVHLSVKRTARFYELGDRDSADVWMVLHGYGQCAAEFVMHFEILAAGRRILAPEGLSRFYNRNGREVGASWMTREDRLHEIADYVNYLDAVVEHAGATSSRITVLGFSQGGHTACRWAAAQPEVGRVIVWSSTLPRDLNLTEFAGALRKSRIDLVVGTRDRVVDEHEVEDDAERLREMGLNVSLLRFEGSHEIRQDVLEKIP